MDQIRKQLTRFVIVGIGSTFLNFLAYYLSYKLGVNLFIASFIGYLTGLINSYILGRNWVFEVKEDTVKTTSIRFILIYAFGCIGMSGTVAFTDQFFGWDYRVCWFFGAVFAFVNNFIGSKWLVFKKY